MFVFGIHPNTDEDQPSCCRLQRNETLSQAFGLMMDQISLEIHESPSFSQKPFSNMKCQNITDQTQHSLSNEKTKRPIGVNGIMGSDKAFINLRLGADQGSFEVREDPTISI